MLIILRRFLPEARMMLLTLVRRIFPEFEAIDVAKMMPEMLKDMYSLTTPQIIFKIHEAMKEMKKATEHDDGNSSNGQEESRRMNEDQTRKGVDIFDYSRRPRAVRVQ